MVMSIKQAKEKQFKYVSLHEWQQVAEKSLRGKSIDDLTKDTYENISLKPLYTKEDRDQVHVEQYPGRKSSVRGFGIENDWKIAQTIHSDDWNEVKEYFETSLEFGQETISFEADALSSIEHLDFNEISKIVDLQKTPLNLKTKKHFTFIANKLLQIDELNLSGVCATDHITNSLSAGLMIDKKSEQMKEWASTLEKLDEKFPQLKTVLIDTVPYSAGGASAVQELGSAIAAAVAYIEYLSEQGWEREKIAEKLVFHFAIGTHFFTEVAKLRAFRQLWQTIAEAYGIPLEKRRIILSAETSPFTKSKLDPYVNMLRAGNEAFAAVVGGIDYLHVAPFNFKESDLSRRVARNTQLLLREESYLNRVVDPAGGSYFIESLTANLVEKGWEFFQQIDREGGIFDALQKGWLQNEIATIQEARIKDSETRKSSLIGVNVYPQLTEKIEMTQKESNLDFSRAGKIAVEPIVETRLAEKFEQLRIRADVLREKDQAPIAGLVCLGQLKDYKARADFVTGVLAAGGIQAEWSEDCMTMEDVKQYIQQSSHSYYCICGPDEQYEKLASEIGNLIQGNNGVVQVDIAGRFSKDELKALQIEDTIHLGQNIYEKLDSLLHIWEERANE